ncbi:MAG: hypothetical protein K2Q21_05335 [Chitinophagaceae bacterium]|nr:hypothetical protein [Chitinophagaceae bacterium]
MFQRLLATLILIFSFSFIHAQTNFSSGWVVLNSGDTIRGEILEKDWNINPKEIKFKKVNTVTYKISDLKAFGINGESLYQRFAIIYHLLPIDEAVNYATNQNLYDTDTVWLKVLVSSTISLGEFRNQNRVYFYSITNNNTEELVYGKGLKSFTDKKYESDARYGTNAIEENLTYKQQLFALNKTSKGDISNSINSTEYNSFSLAEVFNKLNKNEGATYGKDANSFIIGLGVSYYTHNPSGSPSSYLSNATINSNVSPYIMFGYLFKGSKKSSKLAFYIESALSTLNTKGYQNSIVSGRIDFDIKNIFLELQLLTSYTVNPFDRTKFSLGFGMDIMTKISGGNTATSYHGPTYTEVIPNVPMQNSVIASPVFTTNVLHNRFIYFANYQFSKNLNHNMNEVWGYGRLTAGISYKLKKQ